MIFIGLGANLDSAQFGAPVATLGAAVKALASCECRVLRRSSWYRSAPVPPSDQPWFVNGVVEVSTSLPPHELLACLHSIERKFGRVRTEPDAPRVVDLDLLAYDDLVLGPPLAPVVPHPRLAVRAFVLLPLRELAPDWIDPRTGRSLDVLIENLPAGQECYRMDDFKG